jgi:uncharacterized tellurite resistance protein B-like protein
MGKINPLFALGKVIIAAAWADGTLSPDEVISVKHLLLNVRDLTVLQWQTLEMYLDSPVDEAERARLVDELRAVTRTAAEREAVLKALDDVIRADGSISPEEEQVFAQVKAALEEGGQGFFGALTQLMGGSVRRGAGGANNREIYFEEYVKNRVYYKVQRRTGLDQLNIPDGDLRRLSLVAGLVARVARVNQGVSDEERAALVDSLQTTWGATHEAAALIAEIVTTEELGDIDYRMEKEIIRLFTYEERIQLLDVLFAVALADGFVSSDEIDAIRGLLNPLKVSHQDFITAKLKVPKEKRES